MAAWSCAPAEKAQTKIAARPLHSLRIFLIHIPHGKVKLSVIFVLFFHNIHIITVQVFMKKAFAKPYGM